MIQTLNAKSMLEMCLLLLDRESCYDVVEKTFLFTTEVKKFLRHPILNLDFDYPRYN